MESKKNPKRRVFVKKKAKNTQPVRYVPVPESSSPVRPYRDDRGNVTCPSCGEMLHETRLVEHLAQAHGFSRPALELLIEGEKKLKSSWVKVFSGGLPSLGKKR